MNGDAVCVWNRRGVCSPTGARTRRTKRHGARSRFVCPRASDENSAACFIPVLSCFFLRAGQKLKFRSTTSAHATCFRRSAPLRNGARARRHTSYTHRHTTQTQRELKSHKSYLSIDHTTQHAALLLKLQCPDLRLPWFESCPSSSWLV